MNTKGISKQWHIAKIRHLLAHSLRFHFVELCAAWVLSSLKLRILPLLLVVMRIDHENRYALKYVYMMHDTHALN